jgi:peptidoglycan LD-endopeptidase LytH
MRFADRLLTIVVTATLTSAVWIVAGSSLVELRDEAEQPAATSAVAVADEAQRAPLGAAVRSPHRREVVGGERPGDRNLIIPVAGVAASALTDTFTDTRGEGTRLHEAIDIMAPQGTPVIAAAGGTVERIFVSAAGGNTIYVRSPDRETIHYYAHLAQYAPGLSEGQQVERGARLGTVGSTGNAAPDAPHLHFAILRTTPDAEWWEPATALNPFPLLSRVAR